MAKLRSLRKTRNELFAVFHFHNCVKFSAKVLKVELDVNQPTTSIGFLEAHRATGYTFLGIYYEVCFSTETPLSSGRIEEHMAAAIALSLGS